MYKRKALLKLMLILIALVMTVTTMAACTTVPQPAKEPTPTPGNVTTEEETGKYRNKIDITIVSRDMRHNDEPIIEGDSVVKYLEDKFNIKLNLIFVPSPQQVEVFEKLNLMVATGDIPDIMESTLERPVSANLHASLVKQNKLVNIDEYIKNHPGKYPEMEKIAQNPDAEPYRLNGSLYQVPRIFGPYPHAWIIRKDWLDQLNLEEPTNFDELYTVLKAFVEADPDGKNNTGMTLNAFGWWSSYFYAGYTGTWMWTEKDGRYVQAWTLDEQKEGLKFARKLYEEGLLDKEVFVHKAPDARAKFSSGRAGILITPVLFYNQMKSDLKEYKSDAEIEILPADLSGPKAIARFRGNTFYEATAIKSGTDEEVERKMDFLEFLLSDEGDDILINGVEGVHYTKDSSGNLTVNSELFEKEKWGLEGLAQCHGLRRVVDVSTVVSREVFGEEYDRMKGLFDEIDEIMPIMPSNPMDRVVTDVEIELGSTLTDYINKWETDFITGQKDIDASWDEFIAGYKKAGYDRVEEEINTKYKP
jgi:ABC-type glycerol-3-phosphate transport system substrate-binding protein